MSDFTRRLSGHDDYAAAVTALLDGARREVAVFSPELHPVVFERPSVLEAVRGFALRNQHSAMRVLVRNADSVAREGRQLIELARRLSSSISVRALAGDFANRDDAFTIADGTLYALRRQASTWEGLHDSTRPEVAHQLLTAFDEMWAHSTPHPGFRRLHI